MITQRVQDFVSWMFANLARLRNKPAGEVAEAIGDAIAKVDQRLGIEVGQPEDQDRELIVTAYSDPTLFPVVLQIVESISDIPGWVFVALKPPRGFAFTVSFGEYRVQAKTLEFRATPDITGGIQLLIPRALFMKLPPGQDTEELAWLTVETGIGEELCSRIQHIEFSYSENVKDRQPITKLADFVKKNA